jgi:hypothetical protein
MQIILNSRGAAEHSSLAQPLDLHCGVHKRYNTTPCSQNSGSWKLLEGKLKIVYSLGKELPRDETLQEKF